MSAVTKLTAEQMDGKIRFDTCNADAIVCDAIIQYALFGTVVFG